MRNQINIKDFENFYSHIQQRKQDLKNILDVIKKCTRKSKSKFEIVNRLWNSELSDEEVLFAITYSANKL